MLQQMMSEFNENFSFVQQRRAKSHASNYGYMLPLIESVIMQNHRCRKVKNISGGATFRILVGGQGGPNI